MAIHTTGNSVSLTAVEHRNQTAALLPSFKTALGVRGGVHSGLNIAKTSGMGFTISPGRAVIEPAKPGNGPYVVTVDSTVTMAFDPGDANYGRIDLVCVKVDETAGVESAGSIVIVKGTPAATPAVPAEPAAHEVLYEVQIKAGTSAGNGGWLTANRKDVRRPLVSIGSPIPVNSITERNALAPYEGMQVMRLDLEGSVDRYVNGRWYGNTNWYNGSYSAGWRTVTNGTPLRFKLSADGKLGIIQGEVIYTTPNRTPIERDIIGNIPAAAMTAGITPEDNSWVIGTDENYTGTVVIQILANGQIRLGPFPRGKVFMFSGVFPIAN